MSDAHGYDTKRFPMTPAQGRVLYHVERLFRSTGHGLREHGEFINRCKAEGYDLAHVDTWALPQCVRALQIMEECAAPMAGFRDVRTGWETLARANDEPDSFARCFCGGCVEN